MKQKKIKVIIDSDVSNEIDDQFAIAYALSCRDKFDILGITVEPFRVSWQRSLSVRDSLIESRNETYRLLRLFGIKHTPEEPYVFLGCNGFISEGYEDTNPAVEEIIRLAKKHKDVTICCLGTLTNIAMALMIEPEIEKYIKVIWCGTDNIFFDDFNDSNYRNDKEAFNIVVKSNVDFTIFPAYLSRSFVTSITEFSRHIKANNVVKYLQTLMNRFSNSQENMGIKTIHDIGPVAYILQPEKFAMKVIDAKYVVKNKNVHLPKGRKVNYIISMPKYYEIWKDFFNAVNSNKNFYIKPQTYFISDTHINHENKVRRKLVPFSTVEEMNREIIKRWNSVIAPNDIVYHMGDFGDYEFIKQLNGKVILICGNYEKDDYKNFDEFREKLLKLGFADVIEKGMYLDEKILGEKVYLTHKPTDHADDCLTIYGHVHTLKLVTPYGFNACCYHHYFTPLTVSTVKRYLTFIHNFADEDVFA